jgi:hypothetical protein
MVVFCTKSADESLKFRKPGKADLGKSISRERYLPPAEKLEIIYADVIGQGQQTSDRKLLKKGKEYHLERYHADSAIDHWKIMRNVIPAAIWENW